MEHDEDSNNTSLFEEEDEDEEIGTDSRTENGETYSLSSSYSGSCINKEFEDINGDDMTNTDIYSEYTEYEENQNYEITSSTAKYSPTAQEFNEHHVNIEPVATNFINKNNAIPPKSPSPVVLQAKLKS